MLDLTSQRHTIVGRLLVPARRSSAEELLDGEDLDPGELAQNFRDIRRVNRMLGGTAAVLRELPDLVAAIPDTSDVTMLDLATGVADIPLAIVTWARRNGRSVRIVASDVSEEILKLAKEATSDFPEIVIERHDARSVALPDDSFDIVLCSLSLHHFSPDDAVRVLTEMRRLARVGVVVNDLYRSWPGFVAAWIASRLTTRNRLTRNDAPLSVLRAYTPLELADLLVEAGFENPRVGRHLWYRMTAVERKSADAS